MPQFALKNPRLPQKCHNCLNSDTIYLKIVQILPPIFLKVPQTALKMPQIALIVPPIVPNVTKKMLKMTQLTQPKIILYTYGLRAEGAKANITGSITLDDPPNMID